MFENLNFDIPYDPFRQNVVGTVELAPFVVFKITRGAIYAPRTLDVIGYRFSVGVEVHGNASGGLTFKTKEEVIAYLQYQTSLLPAYRILIEKRNALSSRMKPLQEKWFKYADQLLTLSKQTNTK